MPEPTWKRQGFKSSSEYLEHLAKEKGFKSRSEYLEHLAKEKGFKSRPEYLEHLVKEKGFKSYGEYQIHLARQTFARLKGFSSYEEYQEHLRGLEESIKLEKEQSVKRSACKFLREKIEKNVDPESLFVKKKVDFLNEITGCKLKLKKSKNRRHK